MQERKAIRLKNDLQYLKMLRFRKQKSRENLWNNTDQLTIWIGFGPADQIISETGHQYLQIKFVLIKHQQKRKMSSLHLATGKNDLGKDLEIVYRKEIPNQEFLHKRVIKIYKVLKVLLNLRKTNLTKFLNLSRLSRALKS